MTDHTIEREMRISARPETVFRRFVDPDGLIEWMGKAAELDPTPGGVWRVDYGSGDVAVGAFTIVEPPTRVAWTWGWENNDQVPPGSSLVEVVLTPDGDATVLVLRHSGLPSDEVTRHHAEGWDLYLSKLVDAAD